MISDVILPFPVLQQGGGDFIEAVSYEVEVSYRPSILVVTHIIKGNSFIVDLIKDKKAKFSVVLFYKDHAERQTHPYTGDVNDNDSEKQITVQQKISVDFNYAPKIMANIVLMEETTITANSNQGVNILWDNASFTIPAYARLARYPILSFDSGKLDSLIWKEVDEDYSNGAVKTNVNTLAGQADRPITITCAKDVYDALDNKSSATNRVIGKSIITQVLCHIYAYMKNLSGEEAADIHDGLLMHLDALKDKTGEDWTGDDFNASLAATKMMPYAINELNDEADDE